MACTKYVPASHRFKEKPKREMNENEYAVKRIGGKPGDLTVMDGGIWHKAGNATEKSRWALLFYYGPWYMKPYFDYTKILDPGELTNEMLDLLHFTSQPPTDEFEQVFTNITPEEFRLRSSSGEKDKIVHDCI